jgi:hypothetical protein
MIQLGGKYYTILSLSLEYPGNQSGLIKTCLNEIYSRDRRGKNVSDKFPIQNGVKQTDALSPLLFNFSLEYAIMWAQENQKGQTEWDTSASCLC